MSDLSASGPVMPTRELSSAVDFLSSSPPGDHEAGLDRNGDTTPPKRSISLSDSRALGKMKENGHGSVSSASRLSSSVHFADDFAVSAPSSPPRGGSPASPHQVRPTTPLQLHSKSLPHLGSPAAPSKSALKSSRNQELNLSHPRPQSLDLTKSGESSRPTLSASPRPASHSQTSLKRPQMLSRSGSEIIDGKRPSSLLGGYESSGSEGGLSSSDALGERSSRRQVLLPKSRSQGVGRPLSQDVASLDLRKRAKSLHSSSLDGLRKSASGKVGERLEKRAKTSRLDELVARRQPNEITRTASASARTPSTAKPTVRSASTRSSATAGEAGAIAGPSRSKAVSAVPFPAPPGPSPAAQPRLEKSPIIDRGASSPSSDGSRKGKGKEQYPVFGPSRFGGGMQGTVLDAASIHLFLNELSKRDATLAASEMDGTSALSRTRSPLYSTQRGGPPIATDSKPSTPKREPYVPSAPPRVTAGEGPDHEPRDRTVSTASTYQPRMHSEWKSRERSDTVDSSLNGDVASAPWQSSPRSAQRRRSTRLSMSQDGGHVPYTHPVPQIMVNEEESDTESTNQGNRTVGVLSESPDPARPYSSMSTLPTVESVSEATPEKHSEKLGKKHKRLSGLFASLKRKPSSEDTKITRTRTAAVYNSSPDMKRQVGLPDHSPAAGHSTPEYKGKKDQLDSEKREQDIRDKERERREREIIQENRFKAETELQAHPASRQKGLQVATHLNNYYRHVYDGLESPPTLSPLSVLRWRSLVDRRDEQERQWREAKRNGYGASPSDPSLDGFGRFAGPVISSSAGQFSRESPSVRSYGARSGASSRKEQAGELKWGWFMPIGAAWYYTVNDTEAYQACDGDVCPFRPPLEELSPSPPQSGAGSISSGKRANGHLPEMDTLGDLPSRPSIEKAPMEEGDSQARVVPAPSIADAGLDVSIDVARDRETTFPGLSRADSDVSGSSPHHIRHRHTQSLGHSQSLRRRFGGRRATHQPGDEVPSDSAADDGQHRPLTGVTRRNNSVLNLLPFKRNEANNVTEDEPRQRRTGVSKVLSGNNLRGMNDDRHVRAGSMPFTASTRKGSVDALVSAGGLFARGTGEGALEVQARRQRIMQNTLDEQTAQALQERFNREHRAHEMQQHAKESEREKEAAREKVEQEIAMRRQKLKGYSDQATVLEDRLAGNAANLRDWTLGSEQIAKAYKQGGDVDMKFSELQSLIARYTRRSSMTNTDGVQSNAEIHSRSSTTLQSSFPAARPRRRGTVTMQSMSNFPTPVVNNARRAAIMLQDGQRLDPIEYAEWTLRLARDRFKGLDDIARAAEQHFTTIDSQVRKLMQDRSLRGLHAKDANERIRKRHAEVLSLRRRLQGPKFGVTTGRQGDAAINLFFKLTLRAAAVTWFLFSGFIYLWYGLRWTWRHKFSILCALLATGIPSMAAWRMGYLDWLIDLRIWVSGTLAYLLSGVMGRWLWMAWSFSSAWAGRGAWALWLLAARLLATLGLMTA